MKKITLLFFMALLSFSTYAQYPQGFEGTWTTQTTSGAGGPAGWAISNVIATGQNPTTVTWVQGNGSTAQPAHTGSHSAFLNSENVLNGTVTEDWLITPATLVPANGQLRFWSHLFVNGDQGGVYKIMVSTVTTAGTVAEQTNLANYNTTPLVQWTELVLNPTQNDWVEKTVSLSAYAGQTVYLAFVMQGDNGDRWAIDDVNVVSQCLDPTTLAASNLGLTTATLSWTNPAGASATSFELEVIPQSSSPTGVATDTATGTTYNDTGLTQNTDYKFYVRANCGNGNYSNWVGPVNFSTAALGETCAAPITIASLPYTTTDDTANYADIIDGSPGATGCGTTSAYLGGNEVFYAYTAPATGVINVEVTNHAAYTGMFIYNSCANVGVSCVGGSSNFSATAVLSVPSLSVTAGTTYYIVISTWPSPQTTSYTLNIQQVNCAPPVGQATTTTSSSAALSWTNPSGATSWELVVQAPGAGLPSGAGTTVNSNASYPVTTTLPGNVAFTSATSYEYYVRANCGNGTFSAWAGPYTFMTTQVPTTMPLAETWDTGTTNGWSLSNGTQTNKWIVGTATFNSAGHSLYISDNGTANNYNLTSTTVVHAFRDVTIPTGTNQALLSFDWKAVGEGTTTVWDYMRVWLVPTTYVPTPGTQITAANSGGIQVGGNFNQNSAWQTSNNVVNVAAATGTRRLVFEWRNDGGGGTQPPAVVDNINFSVITCASPSALTLGTTTATSATINWTAPTTPPPSYDYYVSTTNTAPTATTTPTGNVTATTHTEGSLLPSTTYYFWVRSHCSGSDSSFWIGPVSYSTPQIPATLPISENWDTGTTNGWTISNGTQTNKWVIGTATFNSPGHSLYVSNDNGVTNSYNNTATSVVHAYRDFTVPAGTTDVSVSFDWKNVGEVGYDYVRVWAVPVSWTPITGTQITAAADRVQVGGNFVGNASWTTYNGVVNMSAFANTNRRIVFEWRNDGIIGTNPAGAIDNVNLSVITCPQPSAVTVTDETTTTISVSWTGNTLPGTTYQVYYVPVGGTAPGANPTTNVVTTTTTSVVLEDLLPSTNYNIWVRSVCSATDNSFWTGPLAHQTDDLCPEPINLQVTCLSSTGAAIGWDADGVETSWEVVVQPASLPAPTSGTVVTDTDYIAEGLTPNTAYTAYVRAVCSEIGMFSTWTTVNFTTNVGPGDAEPFCAGSVSVPNNTGVTGYGSIGCLGSTPNPIWYYLTVNDDDPAVGPTSMNFTLSQVSNTGNPIDVDFAAFGPFTSALDACSQIQLTPGTNPLIVACSYSAAATENFTIPNAQDGQVYAILITNFNGAAGQITLTQTNANVPGAPITSCEPTVELGPDKVLCATGSTTVTADVADPQGVDTYTYVWYIDGDVFTPTIVETTEDSQTIEVDEPGEHIISVIVTTPDTTVNDDPVTDSVTITLSPAFTVPTPTAITLCAAGGTATVDLAAINFLGTLNPADYQVDGVFATNAAAQSNTGAIDTSVPYSTGTTTLYIRVSDVEVPQCFQIVQLSITVNESPTAAISYPDSPFCSEETVGNVTQTGNAGGVYSSTTGLVIDAATGQIDVAASTPGVYTVSYTLAATASCPEFVATVDVTIVAAPEATIAYDDTPYCSNAGTATVTFTGTTGGVYSSTAGLVIDPATGDITLADSTPGTYTVTYTIPDTGDCQGIAVTDEVTITELPTAAISYDGAPYCSNAGVATVTFTGTAGGVYSGTDGLIIDPATGEINLAANAAGTYTVTYTIAAAGGCDAVTATFDVVITQLPEAGFGYTYDSVCQNATAQEVVLDAGASAGTYTVDVAGLAIDAATGTITPSQSAVGTYVVTNTIAAAGGCAEVTDTFTITITPAPDAAFSYAALAYCQDDAQNPVPVVTGVTGTFSSTAGLVINAATGEINLAESTSGTYTVSNSIAGDDSCPTVVYTAEITITAIPVLAIEQGCDDNDYFVTVAFDDDTVYTEDNVVIEWRNPAGVVISNEAMVNITGANLGVYTVSVTPIGGDLCGIEQEVIVERTVCDPPKGISPNGDGKNDSFNLVGFNATKLTIFNRYGKDVYHFRGAYTDEFAGIATNGEKLPTGTYYYMFETTNGTIKTGWVYINWEL